MLTVQNLSCRDLERNKVLVLHLIYNRGKREVTALIGVNGIGNNDYELYCRTITI